MKSDGPRSLVDILLRRSRETPDKMAFTFLADGEREAESLTYGELDRKSRAVASMMQRRVAPGERALLLYLPGLEFVTALFGCFYAGVTAVPTVPQRSVRPVRGLGSFKGIAEDAGVSVVLCDGNTLALGTEVSNESRVSAKAWWLGTDTVPPGEEDYWKKPEPGPDSLAFLQYTSGSTSSPKGVMVTHGNILHNLAYIYHNAENDEESVSVSWLPVYHDMGLVNGVLLPVYGGYPSYIMSPASFLQRPCRWLEAVSKYRATNSGGPNFAFDLCVRKTTPGDRSRVDLSSWRVAYNGAEPIRWSTIEAFHEAFRECGFKWRYFFPVYGLAEATVLVSGGMQMDEPRRVCLDASRLAADQAVEREAANGDTVTFTACGPCSFGTRVEIVHPEARTPCGPGEIGEIWLRSPSVARGYWNRPEATRETFGATLAGSGDGPFLRTGDLGFMSHGELVVTGRIKDLIIVRGRKHYPQDIEQSVEECHGAVRPGCVAAFALNGDGRERLAVAAEVDRNGLRRREVLDSVLKAVRERVAEEHGLKLYRVVLLHPGRIPKTSSGKIRRRCCSKAVQDGTFAPVAEWALDQPTAGRRRYED